MIVSDIKPGDILYFPEELGRYDEVAFAFFVAAITLHPDLHYTHHIMFMALFGCSWSGLRVFKYAATEHMRSDVVLWRTVDDKNDE